MKKIILWALVVIAVLSGISYTLYWYNEWPFNSKTEIKAYGDVNFGMNERAVKKMVVADQVPFDMKQFEATNKKNLFIDLCYANNVVPYSYNPFSYVKGGRELAYTTELFGHTAVVFYRFLKNRLVRVDFAVLAEAGAEDLVKQIVFFQNTIMKENYNYIDNQSLFFNSLNNKIGAVLVSSFGAEKSTNKMVYFINSIKDKGKTVACLVGKNYWSDFYAEVEKQGTLLENNPFSE